MGKLNDIYSVYKWSFWRQTWLYHWILCRHKNAIEREGYGSKWKPEKWTVGKTFGSWTCRQEKYDN